VGIPSGKNEGFKDDLDVTPEKQNIDESDEVKLKKSKIKKLLNKPSDNGFIEVPQAKSRHFPKNKNRNNKRRKKTMF